jgi:hypothetical protein
MATSEIIMNKRVAMSGQELNEINDHIKKNKPNSKEMGATPKEILANPKPKYRKRIRWNKKNKSKKLIPTSLESDSSSPEGWSLICDMINYVFEEPLFKLLKNGDDEILELTLSEARLLFSDMNIRERSPWMDKKSGSVYILV